MAYESWFGYGNWSLIHTYYNFLLAILSLRSAEHPFSLCPKDAGGSWLMDWDFMVIGLSCT